MTRVEMQDTIISIYGLEHPVTVWFFHLCDDYPESAWNDTLLYGIVQAHKMERLEIDW